MVRVRFAPSPTGHIHLGGLRAALYNYIFARQNNGKFILRIEDTDRARVVPGSADEIERILNWAGLKPDESPTIGGEFGPYIQSKRLELYKQKSHELLETGHAYRCFCSPTRLDLLRNYQSRNREKPRYDGKCRNLSPGAVKEKLSQMDNRHVIRLALTSGKVTFEDGIFGTITNEIVESLESDPVILKSDDYPTYHFANVVDDHAMKISHVLRGSEWITSTAKHLQLYRAFGWQEPKFFHFPLITMRDGSKMSKRNNQSHVKSWFEKGYSPRTVLNFLTNIGGGVPKSKQDSLDLWDLDKIVREFNFKQVTCHPGSADINFLNIYSATDVKKTWGENPNEIISQLRSLLRSRNIETDLNDDQISAIINKLVDRLTTIDDLMSEEYSFIWKQPERTCNLSQELTKLIHELVEIIKYQGLDDKGRTLASLKCLAEKHQLDYSKMMKSLRKLLTNSDYGLPVCDIFDCLGQERLLARLHGE